MIARIAIAVLALIVLLWSGVAGAESPEDLYHQAMNLSSMAKFERAVEVLKQASTRSQDPRLLGRIHRELGVNLAILGRMAPAEDSFRTALTHDPELRVDADRVKASIRQLFQRVKESLRGEIIVEADQAGAVVIVDGKRLGTTPHRATLPIGRHEVVVVNARGKRSTHTIVLGVDKPARVNARFGRPAARPARPGVAGAKAPEASEATKQRQGRLWTWIAAGSAVVALGVGIGFGAAADSDYDEYQDKELTKTQGQADLLIDSVESKASVANAMFITSGVLAVAAAVLFFVEGRPGAGERSSGGKAKVRPLLGSSVGLSLSF